MAEQEGVIKFNLEHAFSSPLPRNQVVELIAWRRILYRLQLIGEDPQRYDGFGFGNVSRRLAAVQDPSPCPFVITGTQTGSISDLGPEHFTMVTYCNPEQNRVASAGPVKPSSEAMTHATVYGVDPTVRAVMHVHSPHIWTGATALGLPGTAASAAYGTAEMTIAVREVMEVPLTRELGLFVMGGHEDGVVSFGRTAEEAGIALLRTLARAYQSVAL